MKQNLTKFLLKPVVHDVARSQTLRFSLLLLLLATIPLTALLAQQEQDIRQRAQEIPISPPFPPVCKVGLNTFSVEQPCRVGIDTRPPAASTRSGGTTTPLTGFRFTNFTCQDGFTDRLGDGTTCRTTGAWNAFAKQACRARSSCNPLPTILPLTPPPPTSTPSSSIGF